MKRKLIVFMAIMFAAVTSAWAENSVILYTSSTGKVVSPYKNDAFKDADGNTLTITDNSYKDGLGRMEFNGVLATIGNEAFSAPSNFFDSCRDLETLTIPDGVTSIDEKAFYYCTGLTSISIPDCVTSIGGGAFSGCSGLTSITIPDRVTSIGNGAFSYCSGLTSISIPDGVTSIGDRTFYYCTNLSSISIPAGVTSIGGLAFYGCSGLTSISIPDGVTSIGQYAFAKCIKLTSINLPKRVSSLGDNVFEDCSNLKSLALPECPAYNTLTQSLLRNCVDLEDLTIPSTITAFGSYVFKGLSNLKAVYLPHSTAPTLHSYALDNAPKGVVYYINSDAESSYRNDSKWENKTFSLLPSIKYYSSDGYAVELDEDVKDGFGAGVLFVKDVFDGNEEEGKKVGYYVLAGKITTIPANAFKNKTNLAGIEIPSTVTEIGDEAFYMCTGLTSINIPAQVTALPEKLFYGCTALANVTFESNYNMETIGQQAFNSCTALTSIKLPESITTIGEIAFANCTALTSIKLPESITTIGDKAFWGCTGLSEFTVPVLATLGKIVFAYCNNLKTIYYLSKKESATKAFKYTPNEMTIYVRSSMNVYDFKTHHGITNTVSGSLGEIEYTTDDGKPVYTNVTGGYGTDDGEDVIYLGSAYDGDNCGYFIFKGIPTEIAAGAFSGKSNLTSITLPREITKVGQNAFKDCANLAVIEAGATPATLGTDAFSGISSSHVVNVPSIDSYADYKAANGWSDLNLRAPSMNLTLNDQTPYTLDVMADDCTLSYTREVLTDNWMGVYLPFKVTVTSDGSYATLTGISDGVLDWNTVEPGETIDECTPFIYKPTEFETGEESRNIVFSAENATLYSCNEESKVVTIDGYTLDGTFTSKDDMEGVYALAGGVFRRGGAGAQALNPYRIFLTIVSSNRPNNAPVRNRINGEEVTAIDDIEIDADLDNARAYNLLGLPVADSYKGIVIVNGKKTLRK